MKYIVLLLLILHSFSNAQWERVPEIPGTRTVYSLLAVNDTLYAGTDSLVYVGANAGTQWSSGVPPVAGPNAVGCMVKIGNVLLAGTIKSGVLKSTDNGLSWEPFSAGLSGLGAKDISNLVVRRDSLIAGTLGASVFITSADFSHPWAPFGDSLADYEGDNVFQMLVVGNTVLAGAGGNGYMFRYTDSQPWWNPVPMTTPRRPGQFVSGMASGAASIVAGTLDGIYRSTDEGLSWDRTNAVIPFNTFEVLLAYHDSTFFAITTTPLSSSLLRSTDEGQTWELLGDVPVPNVLSVAIVGDTFYLGTPGGLWRAPLPQLVTSVDERTTAPLAFRLQQNYPNPFNPGTVIQYELPAETYISLRVYNTLGQVVASLVDGRQSAGHKSIKFESSGLASGVYLYRISAGTYSDTKKMILMR